MKKIAAFDIGSNGIRFAVAEIDLDGVLRINTRIRVPVRLGAEVFSGEDLSEHTIDVVVKNFIEFRKILDHDQVMFYKCVATSALRNARNGEQLIDEVFKTSGIHIDLIDGQTEASLIRKAISTKIDLTRKDYLLFDIGGGSAELSLLEKGEVKGAVSLPMGAVRLLEIGKKAEGDGMAPERGYREYLATLDKDIKIFMDKYYKGPKPLRVIGTGGNFKRLSRLRKKIYQKKNVDFVYPDEVAGIREVVEETPLLNRQKRFGLRHDRADVIVPAIYIIENVMSYIPMKKIYTPDIGLIHGILYQVKDHLKGKTTHVARMKIDPNSFYRNWD